MTWLCSRLGLVVALSVAASGQEIGKNVLRWEPGNEYSDVLFVHGFRYKTIGLTNDVEPDAQGQPGLFLAIAMAPKNPRGHTWANLILYHDLTRVDIDPARFSYVCEGKERKELKFGIPKIVPVEDLPSYIQAHTLLQGDELKGILSFKGRCKRGGLLRMPIRMSMTGRSTEVIFEFPL